MPWTGSLAPQCRRSRSKSPEDATVLGATPGAAAPEGQLTWIPSIGKIANREILFRFGGKLDFRELSTEEQREPLEVDNPALLGCFPLLGQERIKPLVVEIRGIVAVATDEVQILTVWRGGEQGLPGRRQRATCR